MAAPRAQHVAVLLDDGTVLVAGGGTADLNTDGTALNSAERYLPMIYAVALREPDESVTWFNDTAVAGSLTMTSFRIDRTE